MLAGTTETKRYRECRLQLTPGPLRAAGDDESGDEVDAAAAKQCTATQHKHRTVERARSDGESGWSHRREQQVESAICWAAEIAGGRVVDAVRWLSLALNDSMAHGT